MDIFQKKFVFLFLILVMSWEKRYLQRRVWGVPGKKGELDSGSARFLAYITYSKENEGDLQREMPFVKQRIHIQGRKQSFSRVRNVILGFLELLLKETW